MEVVSKDSVKARVQSILDSSFSNFSKKKIRAYSDRLNFACPYCGDSVDDVRKKRGNVWLKTGSYVCYNDGCKRRVPVSLDRFFEDFGIQITADEKVALRSTFKDKMAVGSGHSYGSNVFDKVRQHSFDVVDLKRLGFFEIKQSDSIPYDYLKSRLLHRMLHLFRWNARRNELIVLNCDASYTKFIGFQIRPLGKGSSKYQSYSYQRIASMLNVDISALNDEEIAKMNSLSLLFNSIRCNFQNEVTVFEGPLDSFFMNNSVATCSVNRNTDVLDELPNLRYFYDNDKAGRTKMIEKLKHGKNVFMWNKFVNDEKIDSNEVKDLNDLVLFCYKNSRTSVNRLKHYFTSDSLDMVHV